jgi:hypothetical protein
MESSLRAQEKPPSNQLPGTMVIPFREAPLIIVPEIANSLDGGWVDIKYGGHSIFPSQSQAAGQITTTFETLLQETNRFRVLAQERKGSLTYEMFSSEADLQQTLTQYPDLLLADYAFLASLSTLDIGVNYFTQYGIAIEKVVINVTFSLRIIDLHPHKNWHVVDSTDKVFSHERFSTDEEATKEAQRLQDLFPDSQFTVTPPPPRKAGVVVWGKNFGFRLAEGYVVNVGSYYARDINLVRDDLVLNVMTLALEQAVAEGMEGRWPLKGIKVDQAAQQVILNHGGWLIRRAGVRGGIPRVAMGSLVDKVKVDPPSVFAVYSPGEWIRDPDNGILLGRTLGPELAILKVNAANVEPDFSTADIIHGDLSSSDLPEVIIKPIGIEQILDDVKREKFSRIKDMDRFVQLKYGLQLPSGWFQNIRKAPRSARKERK